MDEHTDSRTRSFSLKRPHEGASRPAENGNPPPSPPRKRLWRVRKGVRQEFVPTGPTFSQFSMLNDESVGLDSEPCEDSGSAPSINWNKGSKAKIRTSFRDRSSGLQVGGVSRIDPSSLRVNNDIVHETPAVAPSSARTTSVDPDNSVPESGTGQGKVIDKQSSSEEAAATVGTSHTQDLPAQTKIVQDGLSDPEFQNNPRLKEELEIPASEEAVSANSGREEPRQASSDEAESGQITDDNSGQKASPPSGNSIDNNSENQDALMHYSQSAAMSSDTSRQPQTSSKPLALADLSPEDLELQLRYFFITKNRNEVDLSITVRCHTCGQEGHLAATCDQPSCTTCGIVSDHCTKTCPLNIRCGKCKAQGHRMSACTSKLKQPDSAVVCELCQRKGHVSEDCELVWRTSGRPWESDLSSRAIRLECYECGIQGHLGNDCASRRPGKKLGTSSWTYPGGDHMANKPRDEITIKGRAKQPQVIVIDDSDDEQANFLRPKAPPRERPVSIKIRATHGGGKQVGNHQTGFGAHPGRPTNGYRQNDIYTGTAYRATQDRGQYAQRPADRRSLSPRIVGQNMHGTYRNRGNEPKHPRNDGGYRGNGRPSYGRPPLPKEPLPGAPSHSFQRQGRRGGDSYMPMPSAAQKAWKQHRI